MPLSKSWLFFTLSIWMFIFFHEINCQDDFEDCPAVNKKTCNFKKQVLCCHPPADGGICPQYECLPKQYKGTKKKKCNTKCPIDCGDENQRCDGPVDKKVSTLTFLIDVWS